MAKLNAGNLEHLRKSRRNRVGLSTNDPKVLEFVRGIAQEHFDKLKRAPSEADKSGYEQNLTCLVLDLLGTVDSASQWIGFSQGKGNYNKGGAYWSDEDDKPSLSYTHYRKAAKHLAYLGWAEIREAAAGFSRYSSRIRPTDKLVAMFAQLQADWTAIKENPRELTIIVKDENKRVTSWPQQDGFDATGALENLTRINVALGTTFINLNVSDQDLSELFEKQTGLNAGDEEPREAIDFSNRKLRRVFANNSFSAGGRFYGGWWQGIPSEYRKYIEIDDSITVELDYATLQPRLLYAQHGRDAPKDSYILPGWGDELRPVVKKAFAS